LGCDLASDPFLSNDRANRNIHTQGKQANYRGTLGGSVFSDLTEYNSMLRIMVSSKSQEAEAQELEDLIARPFPTKGLI
jgi:hypothetical protein